jgi:hypothetical protein
VSFLSHQIDESLTKMMSGVGFTMGFAEQLIVTVVRTSSSWATQRKEFN